ncbi:Uncharacterised protein [uncultured archaeon]|nr:Uncharacterised protein [uncultured archaeon]
MAKRLSVFAAEQGGWYVRAVEGTPDEVRTDFGKVALAYESNGVVARHYSDEPLLKIGRSGCGATQFSPDIRARDEIDTPNNLYCPRIKVKGKGFLSRDVLVATKVIDDLAKEGWDRGYFDNTQNPPRWVPGESTFEGKWRR